MMQSIGTSPVTAESLSQTLSESPAVIETALSKLEARSWIRRVSHGSVTVIVPVVGDHSDLRKLVADATSARDETKLEAAEAKTIDDEYIRALHEYNDLKDAAQNMMAVIAERRQVPTKSLYSEFGLDIKDCK